MRVEYRCAVKGYIRVPFSFSVPTNFFTFEFETGPHGDLTHVSAITPVPDKSMWPIVKPSTKQGVSVEINMQSPFFDAARKDLRAAEGMLSLFGLESIDMENAEETWLPDSEQEKAELKLYNFKRRNTQKPVEQWPVTGFDLVARAFLAARRGREIESALNFFRKGRTDVTESRYLEAVFDFLFMIESLFANGKFKATQVETEYLRSLILQQTISAVLAEKSLRQAIAHHSDSRVKQSFARDYAGKTPSEITRHLVKLRGFLHHHTIGRRDIWHPDDHVRYEADALFLQNLCLGVGFKIVEPIWFADEHVREYQALASLFFASPAAPDDPR
jgi:hypothetical protein